MNTSASTGNGADSDRAFNISLWLMPSSPNREHLASVIDEFSQHKAASAPFQPHVTVVGSIPVESEEQLTKTLLPDLMEVIQKSCNSMTCQFAVDPVYKNKWNQACVLVMEESPQFTKLVGLCREIALKDTSTKNWYPPPLCKPHLSLYYGDEGAPSKEDVVKGIGVEGPIYSFEAGRVAIWKTDKASVEGVAEWEELAVIDLPPSGATVSRG